VYLVQDKITKQKYAGKVIQISPRRCLEKQKVPIHQPSFLLTPPIADDHERNKNLEETRSPEYYQTL